MSELILSWLNNDMVLSKKITSFESDFSNGYLFGQILAKHNQQLNFSEFVNKNDKDSRINNFTLLYETFKLLRISFNSNVVMDVIEQKPGVSKKILYELKMQLQRATSTLSAKASKTGLTPLKKVEVSKPIKDQLDINLFTKGLQEKHKAQKQINEQKKLKPFSNFLEQSRKQQKQLQELEQKQIKLQNEHRYNKMRADYKRSASFRKDWDKQNQKNWILNMQIRKNQSNKDSRFLNKQSIIQKHNNVAKQTQALNQISRDTEQFDAKLMAKKNIYQQQQQQQQQQSQRNIETAPIPTFTQSKFKNQMTGSASAFKPKKDNTQSFRGQQYDRKQRDKKRRMMIVNESKHQSLIQLERRQQQLMFNLHQTSKQQKQIEYQIWSTWQNKTVIIENRKLRQIHYNEKQQTRRLNAEFKNQELLRVLREEHQDEIKNRLKRQDLLSVQNKVAERKQNYLDLTNTIFELLNIAEECFDNTQNRNNKDIPEPFLAELFQQFTQKQYTKECISNQELKNYLDGNGVWRFEVQRFNSQPIEPQKQNSIPQKAINNYYLGNILQNIYEKHYSKTTLPSTQLTTDFGVCLLGLEASGKNAVAKQISEQFSLTIIDPQQLLSRKLSQIIAKTQLIQIQQKLLQICLTGQTISTQLMFQFIKQQISKNPRFVLIGYPLTYEQSLLLTKSVSGILPSDYYSSTELQTRLQNLKRLVKPTDVTITPWQIKPCGIDLFLWLDITPRTSIDRFIGKRIINNNVVHINDQNLGNFDSHQLVLCDRGVSVVQQNNFIINNIKDVKQWFTKFGLKTVQGDINCWKQIDASKSINDTVQSCSDEIFTAQQIKQTLKQQQKQKQQDLQKQEQQKQVKKQQKQQLRKKCILSTAQQIQSQLSLGISSIVLKSQYITSWSQTYTKTQNSLVSIYLKSFENLQNQRESNISKLANIKRRFINQLNRQDRKFQIVKQFQMDYNQFVSQNKDMVEEGQTKQELHQRVDDLEDKLIGIIDSKKDDVTQEKNNFMNSGWLESEIEFLYSNVEMLVQAEIQRTYLSQQILTDYYCANNSLQTASIVEFNNELVIDNTLEIISGQEFPRLEKLFSQALRVFNREQAEVIDDKNKKGGKAPPPKKDDKKQGKKKDEVEQKKQPTKQQLQMISAVNTQKSVFRYRINILKQYAKRQLKTLKTTGTTFYKNIEQLIDYTEKVQLSTVQSLSKIIRKYIESQQLIQKQIEVNTFDVLSHHNLLNFQDPKPIIKPARQIVFPDKFPIGHLQYMIHNFIEQGEKITHRIANHKLLTVLIRTTNHRQTSLRLPQTWRSHTFQDYDIMIRNLDFNKDGFVFLQNLFLFFILCNLKIPTQQQIQQWKNRLLSQQQNNLIQRQQFINTECWFQQLQKQPEQLNTYYFDRPKQLKQLLFDQLKIKDEDKLDIDHLVSCVMLEEYDKGKKQGQTYYEYMFNK